MNDTTPQPTKRRTRKPKREDVSDCVISLRTTRDRKRAYRKAAATTTMSGKLTDWATLHLDTAANYPEGTVEKG